MLANGWSARMRDWPRHSSEHIDRPNFVPADLAPVATDTVAELLATGCIEDVIHRAHLHHEVSYILPLLMVPKKGTDKMRMCFDARELNQRIENFHFKMETADVAARLMRPGDYMFTIDLAGLLSDPPAARLLSVLLLSLERSDLSVVCPPFWGLTRPSRLLEAHPSGP